MRRGNALRGRALREGRSRSGFSWVCGALQAAGGPLALPLPLPLLFLPRERQLL